MYNENLNTWEILSKYIYFTNRILISTYFTIFIKIDISL